MQTKVWSSGFWEAPQILQGITCGGYKLAVYSESLLGSAEADMGVNSHNMDKSKGGLALLHFGVPYFLSTTDNAFPCWHLYS
jgi:hypothetical protein